MLYFLIDKSVGEKTHDCYVWLIPFDKNTCTPCIRKVLKRYLLEIERFLKAVHSISQTKCVAQCKCKDVVYTSWSANRREQYGTIWKDGTISSLFSFFLRFTNCINTTTHFSCCCSNAVAFKTFTHFDVLLIFRGLV